MDANTLLGIASQSRYLRAVDVGDGQLFQIDRVTVESLRQDGGQEREKGVVWFRGEDRGLVLNVTLTVILRELFGVDLAGWAGKRITLHNDKSVRRGGKAVGGIRIKSSPDISKDVTVTAGGNAFSKGTRYTIRAEQSGATEATPRSRFVDSLRSAGLHVEDFDTWARGAGRDSASMMSPEALDMAADWISKGGARAIRKTVSEKPAAAHDDFEDPMAV
tara:strand:- start:971 stop:1627 length:657 start_codon:yes stop_codon:yes gene_type:complete